MATLSEVLSSIYLHPIDFGSDLILAAKIKNEMDKTGNTLVNKYGSGQGNDIDNYYHPLLHCMLGQKGHKTNSDILGYGKEIFDYARKVYLQGKNSDKTMEDCRKDLQNNGKGYIIGEENPEADCRILLDDLRTRRMKDEEIY